ncbi:mediator of RNA polymerase II transcription subunit 8 [Coniothyrium glycines]
MNQNFLGEPSREDYRLLEDIRRNLIPMITAMDRLQAQMQFAMNRGEAVDWSQVQPITSRVAGALSSMNSLINGGYKHESIVDKETRNLPKKDEAGNVITDAAGNAVLEAKEVTVTRYRDVPQPPNAKKIRALHPFPAPPFPMSQGNAAGMANTLLRKRLEPMEEGWVEARLRKAAEFVHVPAEWEIEPKRHHKDNVRLEPPEGDDGFVDELPTKRVQSKLSENDILGLWTVAHQEAFDRTYQRQRYPEEFGEGQDEEEVDEEEDEDDDDDDDDDDEFEDVMDTSHTPDANAAQGKSDGTASAPAAVARTTVPKPDIHKPIPGLPMMSLGYLHKFMCTGEATG